MATAGYSGVVRSATSFNTDGSTGYTELTGVRSVSWTKTVDMLLVTALSDDQDQRRIQGLRDCEITIECDWVVAGSDTGQAQIRDSLDNNAAVYIAILPDGTNGYGFSCLCESYNMGTDVEGKSTITYNLVLSDDGTNAAFDDIGSP